MFLIIFAYSAYICLIRISYSLKSYKYIDYEKWSCSKLIFIELDFLNMRNFKAELYGFSYI